MKHLHLKNLYKSISLTNLSFISVVDVEPQRCSKFTSNLVRECWCGEVPSQKGDIFVGHRLPLLSRNSILSLRFRVTTETTKDVFPCSRAGFCIASVVTSSILLQVGHPNVAPIRYFGERAIESSRRWTWCVQPSLGQITTTTLTCLQRQRSCTQHMFSTPLRRLGEWSARAIGFHRT